MKDIIYGILGFVNAVVCLLFLFVCFSDRLNPVEYPLLSCAGLFFPFLLLAVLAFIILWLVIIKRYVFLSVATLIVAYAPIQTYTPLARPGNTPAGNDLHIVSYNVGNFFGDTLYKDTSMIVEYIEASGADIVCLQESKLTDAKKTELHKFYPYIEESQKTDGTVLTTLSKHPILSTEFVEYESATNASVCMYIKYKDDTLRVINNHMESTKIPEADRRQFKAMVKGVIDDTEKRQESKQMLRTLSDAMVRRAPQADALAEFIGKDSRNTIFVGDMNDTPISYAHHKISEVLTDCYRHSGNLWGFSYMKDGMYVRIDHSFCSEDWIPEKCFIDNSIGASDHYPIVTYLKKDRKK